MRSPVMRSPEQQFAFAKTLPIPELAKVMQGQSDVVDMAIAQMVLRGKTRAQKMQQGMAAQQMAQQPKVAEKDLMEAGIAAAPVDLNVPQGGIVGSNGQMTNTGAGGGIVAFADGGVPRSNQPTFIGSLSGGNTVDPAVLRAYYVANGLPVPEELKNIGGRAAGRENQSYDPALYGQPSDTVQSGYGEFWPALKDAFLYNSDVAAQREAEGKKVNLPTMDQLRGAAAKTRESMTPGGRYELDQGRASSGIGMQDVIDYARQQAGVKGGAAAAKPSPEEGGIAAISGQLKSLRSQLTKPDLTKTGEEVDRIYREAGITMDPYADYKKALEAEGKSDAEARKEAGWMRLLEAGLGIMGGESPYALTNIGKGSQAAIKGYGEDVKEFRKAAKDRNKALADVAAAENSLKKGVTDAKLQRYDRAQERYDSASMKLYEIDATLSMEKAKLAVAKGAKVTEVALKEANDQMQKELALNPMLAQDPTAYNARLSQLINTFVSALEGKGTAAATQPQGKVVNGVYVPAGK